MWGVEEKASEEKASAARGKAKGGLGAESPAANEFLRFSHKKTLVSAHFLIEKRHADICSECSLYRSVRQFRNVLVAHV